jgi:Domain of unknown function (DUF4396)
MIPAWLHILSLLVLLLGVLCALAIAIDVARHPQKMWIMNVVWPVVALFGLIFTVWGYFRYGRASAVDAPESGEQPLAAMVAKGTSHCGAGCTIGDIIAETLALALPGIAVVFGWHWLFGDKTFAVWVLDYILAFVIGIAFQYFTIAPMRHLGFADGVKAAIKADAASLTAWQVGMYAFMAFAQFYLFRHRLGTPVTAAQPEFWFMMQIAMLCGFATAYPVNWWLLRVGLKEKM